MQFNSTSVVSEIMPESIHDTLIVPAPAKINLTLAVCGKRSDGFHDLESWVVCVDLADKLAISRASQFELTIDGDDSIPTDDRNLVHRAAHLLARRAGIEPNVSVQLTKRIPVGAGLGGGSSDAAACLSGLNWIWRLGLGRRELAELGAELGSDVPLFLHGGQLVMRGRGEQIEKMDQPICGWAVLICPRMFVSTARVYGAIEHIREDRATTSPWRLNDLRCTSVLPHLFNDLEAAAFVVEPSLRALHRRLNAVSDRAVRVTGSGASMFTLFDEESAARQWASHARDVTEDAFVQIRRILTNTDDVQI